MSVESSIREKKRMPEQLGEMRCRNRRECTYGLLLLILGVAMGCYIGFQWNTFIYKALVQPCQTEAPLIQPIQPVVETRGQDPPAIKIEHIPSVDLQNKGNSAQLHRLVVSEDSIDLTMRSCLGSECFDELVAMASGGKKSRIGLLALKNSGAEVLLSVIKSVSNEKDIGKVELVYENHVPAYGYGKNHGWSSIIRLARKVMPHALSLAAESNVGLTKTSVDLQVRQLVRWHCRLSHVAAHTRMLTVFVEDLLQRPVFEFEKIITFMGLKFDRPKLVGLVKVGTSDFSKTLLTALGAYNISANHAPTELLDAGIDAIDNEYASTKGLTKWPCKMFRDLKSPSVTLALSASDVAANCQGPYVRCEVQYDQAGG